ncbi:hypothetical protein GJAV_G00237040 [Gymnothorax javanicus]|nr:hypothetical protein GJAV_G00237040 [Gymnothorax javanicus]
MRSLAATVLLAFLMILKEGFSVPPPVNLTVQCHNLSVMAYWNYSQPSLQPNFTVKLIPYTGDRQIVKTCANISHHHCDVSRLVLRSVLDSYYLNVTAVVGSEHSEDASSLEFTYNMNMVEDQHCSLDFPSANLSVWGDVLTLQFPHPWDVYRAALQQEKKNQKRYRKFSYLVHFPGQKSESLKLECDWMRGGRGCERHLPVSEAQEKHCLTLEGRMNDILVASAEEICVENQPLPTRRPQEDNLMAALAVVIAFVVLVVLAVIAILAYRRKTKGTSAIPKIVASLLASPHTAGRLLQPESDATSEVLSVDPRADPAPEAPQDCIAAGTPVPVPAEGSRFPIGVGAEHDSGSSPEPTCDGSGMREQERRSAEEEAEQANRSWGRTVTPSWWSPPDMTGRTCSPWRLAQGTMCRGTNPRRPELISPDRNPASSG